MDAIVTADSHLHTSGRYLGIDGEALAAYRERRWRGFEWTVAAAIEGNVDLFVHCGDLFDVADPGTDPLARLFGLFRDLERAGVTPVVVPGNHDYSRVVDGEEVADPEATTPVDALAAADVGIAFTGTGLETRTVAAGDEEVWVGGVGYDPSLPADADPLAGLDVRPPAGADATVLLTHHCIEGHEWDLAGWPTVARETLADLPVEAVCSGHVHAPASSLAGDTRVLVPGAIDRRGFGEAAVTPGYYRLALGDGTATFHPLEVRRVVDERVSAATLPDGAETAALADRIAEWATAHALIRVCLEDPDGVVDRAAVRRAGRAACHVAIVDA